MDEKTGLIVSKNGFFEARMHLDGEETFHACSTTRFVEKYGQVAAKEIKTACINHFTRKLAKIQKYLKGKKKKVPEEVKKDFPSFRQMGGALCDDVERRRRDEGSVLQRFPQPQGVHTCMPLALCNALDGFGEQIWADKLYAVAGKKEYSYNFVEKLKEDVKKACPTMMLACKDLKDFDVLNSAVEYPTLVLLQKTCGLTDHAVALLGDTIYDSCNDFTLKRTKENFDHACRPCTFGAVWKVLEMVPDSDAAEEKRIKNSGRRKRKFRRKALLKKPESM